MGKRSKKMQARNRALRAALRESLRERPSRQPKALLLVISASLFVAENFWGGSLLANLSLRWGYILFLLSNGVILGWWTWLLVGVIYRGKMFSKRIKFLSALMVVLILGYTSPHYVSFFVKPQGSIQIPPYTLDSTQVVVSYGNRHIKSGYQTGDAITSIGELKQKPFVSLAINGQDIFSIHINDQREVCIDTKLFTGIQNQSQHIFYRPVVITNNAPDALPNGWHEYQNSNSVEIDNQDGIPVLLMEYKKPYRIIISGLFVTPWGICKVDNEAGNLYILGDNMTQLGTYYKVDQVSIHSIPDLFRSEHTYDLSEWR
jgi:hypothetical protein